MWSVVQEVTHKAKHLESSACTIKVYNAYNSWSEISLQAHTCQQATSWSRTETLLTTGQLSTVVGCSFRHAGSCRCACHTFSYGAPWAVGNASAGMITTHMGVRDRVAGLWNPVTQLIAFPALWPIMIAGVTLVHQLAQADPSAVSRACQFSAHV